MGIAYAPTCEACFQPAATLGEGYRWLCRSCSMREEPRVLSSLAMAVRSASVHEQLVEHSVAYRGGFERLDECNPYDSETVDAALWRLGSLAALRGAL